MYIICIFNMYDLKIHDDDDYIKRFIPNFHPSHPSVGPLLKNSLSGLSTY